MSKKQRAGKTRMGRRTRESERSRRLTDPDSHPYCPYVPLKSPGPAMAPVQERREAIREVGTKRRMARTQAKVAAREAERDGVVAAFFEEQAQTE